MENTAKTETPVIIETVKSKLRRLKLTHQWAAEMMGYSSEYLRKLFKGIVKPTEPILKALEAFKEKLDKMELILAA